MLATSASANATTAGNPGSPVTITADGAINVVDGGDRQPASRRALTVYWTEGSGVNARVVGVPSSGSASNVPAAITDAVQNRPADTGLGNADVAGDFNTSMVFQTTEVMNHDGISVASYNAQGQQVLTASGMNFPDALSAGAVAAQADGMAVLLTDDTAMPAVTADYIAGRINGHSLTYLAAVGGQADKALDGDGFGSYEKLGGADRYATSYNVASHLFSGFTAVGIATGTDWPDSLSGGALKGRYDGPLALVGA